MKRAVALVFVAALLSVYFVSDDDEVDADDTSSARSTDVIVYPPAFMGHFSHRATGNTLADWKIWVHEAKDSLPLYPRKRYSGKGIAMSAGGLHYFTQAYVNIRVIREVRKCFLPIEVFYAGDEEMSPVMVQYMHTHFKDVTFIDITTVTDFPAGLSMKGHQIKVFSVLMSSFEEVLFIDADNLPLLSPSIAFEFKPYLATGPCSGPTIATSSLLGPKHGMYSDCQLHPTGPDLPNADTAVWRVDCSGDLPFDLETGQIVVNKRRAWKGLMMTAFINMHHKYFIKGLINDDKLTWGFGFNTTQTPYAMVNKHPFGVGLAVPQSNGKLYLCSNTMGQRHPTTGEIMFLHRNQAKFSWTYGYLMFTETPRVWTHVARQAPTSSWHPLSRKELPPSLFFPKEDNMVQAGCFHPIGEETLVIPAPEAVLKLEDACFEFLKDLAQLPFYPTNPNDCGGDKAFLCGI